jgi:hypothetical protein
MTDKKELQMVIDNTRELLLNNFPIEEKLHVIAVVSNPCNFKIRWKLTQEFMKRMEKEPDVIFYLVEMVYGEQEFEVTSATNKRHLQVRCDIPLWHKENMINLGVKHLLPKDWKAFAWIDADIDFDNVHWASDALKLLNGGKDFIQLFSHAIDMDFQKKIMNTFTSFAYQYSKNFKKGVGINYWHPGFAWACNRYAYEKLGGIFEEGIMGSGDNIMCHAFIKKAPESLKEGMSKGYIEIVREFQNKVDGLRLGYVPGPIRHYFHGKKENRNYYGREDILIKYQFDPNTFIKKNETGIIIPTKSFQKGFLDDIMIYFKDRNEDEMVLEEIMSKNSTDKEVLEYKINFILHEFEKLKKKAALENESKDKQLKIEDSKPEPEPVKTNFVNSSSQKSIIPLVNKVVPQAVLPEPILPPPQPTPSFVHSSPNITIPRYTLPLFQQQPMQQIAPYAQNQYMQPFQAQQQMQLQSRQQAQQLQQLQQNQQLQQLQQQYSQRQSQLVAQQQAQLQARQQAQQQAQLQAQHQLRLQSQLHAQNQIKQQAQLQNQNQIKQLQQQYAQQQQMQLQAQQMHEQQLQQQMQQQYAQQLYSQQQAMQLYAQQQQPNQFSPPRQFNPFR